MSSVEKYTLKSGEVRWRVRYDIMVGSKRRQEKKSGFKRERDAKKFAAGIDQAVYNHTLTLASKVTLREYLGNYLDVYGCELQPKTLESYKSIMAVINNSRLADMLLQDITPEDVKLAIKIWRRAPTEEEIRRWEKQPKPKGRRPRQRSANTVNHYLRFLSMVLNAAVKNNRIARNPCDGIDRLRTPKPSHYILTVEEYNQLLQTARGHAMYAPILLAGWMGLRREEALGLKWSDVDLKSGSLHIRSVRQIAEGVEYTAVTKTESSRRDLILPVYVLNELKRLRHDNIIDLRNPYVCTESDGTPVSICTFTRRYKRLLKKAGLPETIRFHDLRHTCASLLVMAGASMKEISDYLGHSGIGITMDLYAGIYDSTKQSTAMKLNALLTGSEEMSK